MTGILPTLIGTTTHTEGAPGTVVDFTLAAPAASQAGDLHIASILTLSGTMIAPSGGFTSLYRSDVDGGIYGVWDYGVWARVWDGDTTPVSWHGGGLNSGQGQYFGAFLAAFRNGRDPSRPLVHTNGQDIAGLPGRGPAVCITWVRSTSFENVSTLFPFAGTDWTEAVRVDGSYVLGSIAFHADVAAAQTTPYLDTNPYLTFGLIGRTLAPPCRLYPREDQLGVGSGRIWPPPKSHQASPRRAGGYY